MHFSAIEIGKKFFEVYADKEAKIKIVDIGSRDVNGSLRSLAPINSEYIGLDFESGNGVDIVINDPYNLPVEDNSIDIVVCSSCFEHSEFFWLLFNEIQRILKPSGLLYLNVPSNGLFHRYPVDCYRFYPDSGIALQNWGRRSGFKTTLLESFTGKQRKDRWNDFVAVFVKDSNHINNYPNRIQNSYNHFTNGLVFGSDKIKNLSFKPQDQRKGVCNFIYNIIKHPYLK